MSPSTVAILYLVGYILTFFGSAIWYASGKFYRGEEDGIWWAFVCLLWPVLIVFGFIASFNKAWLFVHDYFYHKKRRYKEKQ